MEAALIKNSGGNKHHDSTSDFFGDGRTELTFWSQKAHKLFLAVPPADPLRTEPWPLTEIYSYRTSSQPEQRGNAASFKGINEHEGLIDGDGNSPDQAIQLRHATAGILLNTARSK